MFQPQSQDRERRAHQKDDWLELRLLDAVENGRFSSQREAAAELGIALGLVNVYVKRCVKKGWLKVLSVPARRYIYYLTPQGFSEKARLSAVYLRSSMNLFRKSRTDYAAVFGQAEGLGWQRVALVGLSDMTEIAYLCAQESPIKIVAIIAPEADRASLLGVPIIADGDVLLQRCDGLVLTQIDTSTRQQHAPDGSALTTLIPRFLERSLFEPEAPTTEATL